MDGRTIRLAVQLPVILLILGGLACCLWPVVRDARGPRGDPIPPRPPDERNRVHHPLGYSIVAPPDWDRHVGGSLVMAPATPGRYARRSRALIVVTRLGHDRPAGLERMDRVKFQGQAACEGMRVVRPWTFDDGAWSEYTLYLEHHGDWYEIRYGIAEQRARLPDKVRLYLNTLRWQQTGDPAPDRPDNQP